MGTRSHTYFVEGETPICCLYRQFDGYVEGGHGEQLAKFLAGKGTTNGLNGAAFNGMGDLAVRTVVAIKNELEPGDWAGNLYIERADTPDDDDYGYFVSIRDGAVHIVVTSWGKRIFAGSPEQLLTFKEPVDAD